MNKLPRHHALSSSGTAAVISYTPVPFLTGAPFVRFNLNNMPELLWWIEQHLDQKLTAASLAAVTGYSPRHLFSLFRRLTGQTPADHIRLRKLTLAANLLRNTRRAITDIANMYAFSTLQAFTRTFRHHFGQSPRAYRQADRWDMGQLYPSSLIKPALSYQYQRRPVRHCFFTEEHCDVTRLNFGFNLLLMTDNARITNMSDIQAHYTRLLSRYARPGTAFSVLWDIRTDAPGCDATIHAFTGQISTVATTPFARNIAGNYACFTATGTFRDIIEFMAWIRGNGLHRHHNIVKRGPVLSCFSPAVTAGLWQMKHCVPVTDCDSASPRPG